MQRCLWLLLLGLVVACSDDDDTAVTVTDTPVLFSDFSVVSFDDTSFYTYDFDGATQVGITKNITATENIPRDVAQVYRQQNIYGFYGLGNAYVRDFKTGEVFFVGDFGGQDSDEQRITARNDKNTLGMLFKLPGDPNVYVRLINVINNSRVVLNLGVLPDSVTLYIKDDLAIVVVPQDAQTTLRIIDVNTTDVLTEISVNDDVSGIIFGDENDFYVFTMAQTLYRYDMTSLALLETAETDFVFRDFATHKLIDRVIYSEFYYPQPNFFERGPAAFNLATNTSNQLDLGQIYTEYRIADGAISNIAIVDFDYDVGQNLWLTTFIAELQDGTEQYGIFAITPEGEIVNEMSLDKAPWTIITY